MKAQSLLHAAFTAKLDRILEENAELEEHRHIYNKNRKDLLAANAKLMGVIDQVAKTLTWNIEGPYGSSPDTLDYKELLSNIRKAVWPKENP
jgi:hypothetical protein